MAVTSACGPDSYTYGPSEVINETGLQDRDGDGFDETVDCNDSNPFVHPDAEEECDRIDNDCDDEIDEPGAVDGNTYYSDADGDGYGDPAAELILCEMEEGVVENDEDCDDTSPLSYPGADELCDGEDNDCDTLVDNANDLDGDGYDDVCGGDCDDGDEFVHPAAEEICDTVDNNCDGVTDGADATGAVVWYVDSDADGFGDPDSTVMSCEAPEGAVADNTDCDDTEESVNPDEVDLLDGLDNDCDGHQDHIYLRDVETKLFGNAIDAYTGYSVMGMGDLDGDGYDDVAIGATNESNVNGTSAGAAYVFHGPFTGSTQLDHADSIIFGDSAEAYASREMAACDFDGDGYQDIALGAWGDDTASADAGAVYITYGPFNATSSLSDAQVLGESSGDYAGWAVACAGDVNGDNFDDLLVASPNDDDTGGNSGAIYVVHGPIEGQVSLADADAKLIGEAGGDLVGASLSYAGDVNGDGLDDILVGASSNDEGGNGAGATYMVLAPFSGTMALADADTKFIGEEAGDFARVIANVGDIDNDGNNDIVVGALFASAGGDQRGRAYVFHGPVYGDTPLSSADNILDGGADYSWVGAAVSGAGDIDGDGYDDFLVGAPASNSGKPGYAYLFYGPLRSNATKISHADAYFIGESLGDSAGWALSGAGDTNGDGWGDLIIGAKSESTAAQNAGAAYVVLGGGR